MLFVQQGPVHVQVMQVSKTISSIYVKNRQTNAFMVSAGDRIASNALLYTWEKRLGGCESKPPKY